MLRLFTDDDCLTASECGIPVQSSPVHYFVIFRNVEVLMSSKFPF